MNNDDIVQALHFRHACKLFDNQKPISSQDIDTILEAGILAPSSFGLEPWQFVVTADSDLKSSLQKACFNQPQVSSCSHFIAIAGRKDVRADQPYLEKCLDRFGANKEAMKPVIEGFLNRLDDKGYEAWVAKQCYIAGTQMMFAAAGLGIDSCPMEGFMPPKVHKVLGLEKHLFIALVIPFGYRQEEPKRGKMRFAKDEILIYK